MYRFILSSMFLVWISVANAAADDPLDNTLLQKQTELNALTQQIETTIAQLADEQVSLQRHTEGLLEANEKLIEAEADMNAKLKAAEANPEETIMRESVLATIRFNRYETRVKRYTTRKQESEAAVEKIQTKLDGLVAQQKDLQSVIAQFAEQLAQRNARVQAEQVSAAQQVVEAKQVVETKQEAEPVVKAPAPASTPIPAVKGTWPYLSVGEDPDIRFARTYLAELAEDKAKGEIDSAPLPEVELIAKDSFGKTTMEYIGDDLYKVVKTVRAGSQRFSLFKQDYWHTIPEADDKVEYVFIFDVSSLSNPELFLFKHSLMSE